MAAADPAAANGRTPGIDPYDAWLIHYHSHGGIIAHPKCPWCQPLVIDPGEEPWLILGGFRIYAPRGYRGQGEPPGPGPEVPDGP